MFEHFSDGARRVLVLAQEEARLLHGSSIEAGHLLLGMLREGEGIAARALRDAGVDDDRARAVIEHDDDRGADGSSRPRPFSEAAMRIIERSVQISWARADGDVETEHLLVALLEEDDQMTERVFAELDVTPEEVVQRVDALMAERHQS